MRVAILSCGAIVVREKEQSWLFGAPNGVKEALDASGIDVPPFVFTTSLRSPGYSSLGAITRFKELPLNVNGLSATPVTHKHGTDYAIEAGDSKILFSERGDVSLDDVTGYDMAVIKNKHRSDKFPDAVITWPWPDAEYVVQDKAITPLQQEIQLKVWSSMDDVPANLKTIDGTSLDLDQANFLARVAKGSGEGGKENWAIAHSMFKKVYKKDGDKWVKKEKTKTKDDDMMDMKLAQDKAGYEPKGGEGVKCCATCEYFCKNLTCCKVEGDIAPNGVCNLWEYGMEDMEDEGTEGEPTYPTPAYSESTYAYMGEVDTNSEGRTAADHLVVGDKNKPSTWALPIGKEGKHDPKLMGGAAAALTVGYRGNKYEGDNKDGAIRKLVAAYNAEKLDVPENLQKAYEQLKEYAGDRPIPRIIDIITAALHKAYNDTSDKLFQVGYLSQDERMVIAKSIGDGLTAFRNAIQNQEFADRPVDKWDADQLMSTKETWTQVYKTEDDTWRWAAITSVATWDRQGEFLTTKAMDWAIAFNKMRARLSGTTDRGPLRYKHIPGLDGGRCDTQLRIGDFLFESGTFDDTPIGLAMRNRFKDGSGVWQISPGLAFAKNDLVNGRYKRAAIFERSMTQRPANPFTIILHKSEDSEMKILTETELKQAASELGMEFEEIKMMYERALASGNGPLGLKEFTEVVEKATGTNASGFPGGANSTHKKDGEEETEMLKSAIDELTEEELKHLAELVNETLKEKKVDTAAADGDGDTMDMTPEEMAAMKKGMKKMTKKEDDLGQLKELLAQQSELLVQQTKAMGELAQALAGQGTTDKVEQAVAGILNQMPRKQAAGFVSQTRVKENGLPDDNQVMQQLKAIQEQLAAQANPGRGIYDAFTSTRLNQKRGVR